MQSIMSSGNTETCISTVHSEFKSVYDDGLKSYELALVTSMPSILSLSSTNRASLVTLLVTRGMAAAM